MDQKTMKACLQTGPNRLEIKDVPVPQIIDPTDAIIKVTMSTICSSDIHTLPNFHGENIYGHECCGEVVEVGSACEKVKVGQRYMVIPAQYCGECERCKLHQYSDCLNGGVFGSQSMTAHNVTPGVFAEYLRVRWADRMLVPIPEGCTEEDVILDVDVLTTGRFLVENAGIKEGDTVAIFGTGPIGMCACLTAKKVFKAKTVIAVDISQERLDMCMEHGMADYVINSANENVVARVMELTGGKGVDISGDTIGAKGILSTMVFVTRTCGTLSTIASYPPEEVGFFACLFVGRSQRLVAGLQYFNGMEDMAKMIAKGEIDIKWMITHKKPLNDIIEGFDVFGGHKDGCIKWVVTPWDHSRD